MLLARLHRAAQARGGFGAASTLQRSASTAPHALPGSSGSSGTGGIGASSRTEGIAAGAATAATPPPPPADPLLQSIIRSDLAAEEAAAALYRGAQRVLGRRPDLASFEARERAHAATLRDLAPAHRVRPSLLAPALRAGFFALGAVSAAVPRPLGAAVAAGLQDALTDVCNEQLRELREQGLADQAPQVRQAVRAMRDEERGVEGAPAVPDVLALQRWQELSPPEALAAAVKFGARAAIGLAGRL